MHNFKKLDIWIKSMDLVTEIYKISNGFPNHEKFGLTSQMQRCAISIPANIAEGSAKTSNKDFARFLEISMGSSFELETQIILSFRLNYIDEENYNYLQNKNSEIQKMINGFKNKLD